jgi:hypothetical protein
MIENAMFITALLVDRWICIDCIRRAASLTAAEVERDLEGIARTVSVHRANGDCCVCSVASALVSVERPGRCVGPRHRVADRAGHAESHERPGAVPAGTSASAVA